MREYDFNGWENADICPKCDGPFAKIKNQRHLYEILSECWCVETCAPRLRDRWSKENKTCGQCSITAFLVQDIFGGDVYGVPLPDGNFHCYNVVDGATFDLTSEQFDAKFNDGVERPLCYENNPLQSREVHFAKEEKRERYERLRSLVLDKLTEIHCLE